jgi:hypothetical protein
MLRRGMARRPFHNRANVGYRTEKCFGPGINSLTRQRPPALRLSQLRRLPLMLLQELPTKMVRHVIKSVTWTDVDIDATAAGARRRFPNRKSRPARTSANWRQLYYLTNAARIVFLRKFRTFLARLGR